MRNSDNQRLMYERNLGCFSHLVKRQAAKAWMRTCWRRGLRFK